MLKFFGNYIAVIAIVALLQAKYPMLGSVCKSIAPACLFLFLLYRLFKSSERPGKDWHRFY